MWQKILEWAKYFLKHKEQTEKNSADIKEQERTIKDLTTAVQHLAYELERQRENEAHERDKLTLRLENILLRSERSLPPGKPKGETSIEEYLPLIEALKQENADLRRRFEQLAEPSDTIDPQTDKDQLG